MFRRLIPAALAASLVAAVLAADPALPPPKIDPVPKPLASDPTGSGDPDSMIIGDLNSYTFETPIDELEAAGYVNLVRQFNGLDAYAVGYRIDLRRGQRLNVELRRRAGNGHLFAEVFEEIPPSDYPMYRLVQSLSTEDRRYTFEANTSGPHVLRLQPELGASGPERHSGIGLDRRRRPPVACHPAAQLSRLAGDASSA